MSTFRGNPTGGAVYYRVGRICQRMPTPILRFELVHAGCVPDSAGSCICSSVAYLAPRWHRLIFTALEWDPHPHSGAVAFSALLDGVLSCDGWRMPL